MEKFIEFIHSDFGLVIIAGFFGLLGSGLTILFPRLFEKSDQKKSNIRDELEKCRKEIDGLRKELDLYEAVKQSATGEYLVQKETDMAICPICWPKIHKAIPIYEDSDTGKFTCGCCQHTGIFDRIKVERIKREDQAASDELWRSISRIQGIDHGDEDFYDSLPYRL